MATTAAPLTLPLLPLPSGVVFPGMVVTIRPESPEARAAVRAAEATDRQLLLVPKLDGGFGRIGTVVRIEQASRDGRGLVAIVRGLHRARLGQGLVDPTGADALLVEAEPLPDDEPVLDDVAADYRRVATELLETYGGRAFIGLLNDIKAPGALADTIGWWPALDFDRKVELLETIEVEARLRLALDLAREALTEAKVSSQIATEVNDSFEKTQREAILRRQMEAIRKELGDGGDDAVGAYREKLAALDLAASVHNSISKEIDRLERLGEQNMESSWIRTWLDTMFDIPWSVRTADNFDLGAARATLDRDHTGLDDVKKRIVEFLAVRKLRAERGVDASSHRRAGTVLVLVGPPGVGKTSLGESVASALGRKFVRTALGGIHDEAEIRGHRRTYVGARPGRIVRALVDAGSMNPVMLLDEIDKLGADWRGDPSSALLEVLDPAQNHTFRDHYLETELDLSDVVFIATANTLDRVPAPLLDRMEVIAINGYSADEKLEIARDHLLPRIYERNAVTANDVNIADRVVRDVIERYTRESGVRRLEQRLDRLVRRAATKVATGEAQPPVDVTDDDVREALGRAPLEERPVDRVSAPGIAAGLAVTGAGGDVLFVEAVKMPGEPGLVLTGQLGDVMRESGEIALSYLRSHAHELDLDASALDGRIHVHFPAGAIPKDGPSAGVTMTTALASLASGRMVRADVGMTGEVTLHGAVLPIGGVKEKVLAAHRAGLRTVILPDANRGDADDIPADIAAELTLHFARDAKEVLAVALS